MENPKAAIDAILESKMQVGSIVVWPLTIARYALLDLLESPFVNRTKKFNVFDTVASVYVMALDPRELAKYSSSNLDQLKQDAFVWIESDQEKSGDVVKVLDLIAKKILDLSRLAPEVVEDSKKKLEAALQTAG